MSMLTRAAKRFDERFAALPPNVRRTVGLAIYRVAPAMAQYQKDLEPLFSDEKILDAIWDLVLGFGFAVVKRGREALNPDQIERLADAAPVTAGFLREVTEALRGTVSGAKVIDAEPEPRRIADGDEG